MLDKFRRRKPGRPANTTARSTAQAGSPASVPRLHVPPQAATVRAVKVEQPAPPRRVAGPSHAGVIAEGQSWGAWMNVRSQGEVELYLRWEGRVTPRVFLYDEQGNPTQLELRAIENGQRKSLQLPLGHTYIAVQNMGVTPQPIRVQTKLPGFVPPLPGAA